MKKTLGLEIEKVAKQLLMVDGNFDVAQMKVVIGRLYEKLIVLEHLEPKADALPTKEEIASLDSKSYREENWFKEPEPVPQSQHKDDLVEPLMEKIKDLIAQMPPESQEIDAILEEVLPSKKYIKNDLEEFASNYQETPTFERKTTLVEEKAPPSDEITLEKRAPAKEVAPPDQSQALINDKKISEKPTSINDAVRNLAIGLNDRIAFIKHLFENSVEDYERVLSQINTFENYQEATRFLTNQVQPEYQNWTDKEEYVTRFMEIVAKRFN
ncbi:MAG: hypothetical protein ACI849_001319 [Patiriisocius sp.]|jgi:hypothetical protein